MSGETTVLEDYRITSEVEIKALLKQLLDSNTLITLTGPGGGSYTTLLWAVDSTRGVISFSAESNDQRLQQLLEGGEMVAVAYLDSIKLQFDVEGALLVHGGMSAINASYPQSMMRYQRRSSFRVKPLGAHQPVAQFRHPDFSETQVNLRVLDISLGGVALFLPTDVPMLAAGVTLRHCQLILDEETQLDVDVVVHHISVMNPDTQGARLGCQLLNLHGMDERALQHYVNQTQKRRHALAR